MTIAVRFLFMGIVLVAALVWLAGVIYVFDDAEWIGRMIDQYGFTEFCEGVMKGHDNPLYWSWGLGGHIRADLVQSRRKQRDEIFKLIAHGDAKHRTWLFDALREYFA